MKYSNQGQSYKSLLSQFKNNEMITLQGRVVDCLYYKRETGFGIYEMETAGYRRFKAAGVFVMPLRINFYYELKGLVEKRQGEHSLKTLESRCILPTEREAALTVLRMLPDLSFRANNLYDAVGENVLRIICDNPEKILQKVPWVKMDQVQSWREALTATNEMEQSMKALQDLGISTTKSKKLIEEFGLDVGTQIERDPYFLMAHGGILTFSECDKIAIGKGMELSDSIRIAAAIVCILKRAMNQDGDCFLPEPVLMQRVQHLTGLHLRYVDAQKLVNTVTTPEYEWSQYGAMCKVNMAELETEMENWQASSKKTPFCYFVYQVPEKALEAGIETALSQRTVVYEEVDGGQVFLLDKIYQSECSVSSSIRNFKNSDMTLLEDNEDIVDGYCNMRDIRLEKKQREAVIEFTKTRGGIYILCGAAGCGKTFTLKTMLGVLGIEHRMANSKLKPLILAPTGKAAKVASDATGMPASTIHKALGLIGDDDNPFRNTRINANCVVIDEFSMVDIFLATKLLSKIPSTSKVIIMGDANQLPSIGPGAVLRDMIQSDQVPTVILDVVKRQNKLSGILVNANKILAGEEIETEVSGDSMDDGAIVDYAESPVACRNKIVETFTTFLHEKQVPLMDLQVLCPQKKTEVGIDVLNLLLQEAALGKGGTEQDIPDRDITYTQHGEQVTKTLFFRKGDKVIHVENNYSMEWYRMAPNGSLIKNPNKVGIINGEMGVICKTLISKKDPNRLAYQILVMYSNGYVLYKNDTLSQLQHAYAMTIHRAQGSQWPMVIAPMMMCNYGMLARNLFYTLYTRAQTTNVVIGQRSAIQRAIDNVSVGNRMTSLARRI